MTEILFPAIGTSTGTLGLDLAIGPVHCSVFEVSAVCDLEVSGTSARNALAELPESTNRDCGLFGFARRASSAFTASGNLVERCVGN